MSGGIEVFRRLASEVGGFCVSRFGARGARRVDDGIGLRVVPGDGWIGRLEKELAP